jgi:hypothetical protein
MTLLSRGLVWYTDGWKLAGRSGVGVCGVRPEKRLYLSPDVCATVAGRILCNLTLCKKCIGRGYTDEHTHIHAQIAEQLYRSLGH